MKKVNFGFIVLGVAVLAAVGILCGYSVHAHWDAGYRFFLCLLGAVGALWGGCYIYKGIGGEGLE